MDTLHIIMMHLQLPEWANNKPSEVQNQRAYSVHGHVTNCTEVEVLSWFTSVYEITLQ